MHLSAGQPGSGAFYSSAEDLYRWDQALYTEALLPRASLERMFTPYVEDITDEQERVAWEKEAGHIFEATLFVFLNRPSISVRKGE